MITNYNKSGFTAQLVDDLEMGVVLHFEHKVGKKMFSTCLLSLLLLFGS